ncbi:MAG: hypothetical protein SFY69_07970 [Planctomycetota bacterium]|nr:hypothetical protein [Planctomycetota bacterium]
MGRGAKPVRSVERVRRVRAGAPGVRAVVPAVLVGATLACAGLGLGGCASRERPDPVLSAGSQAETAGVEVSWWLVEEQPAAPGAPSAREVFASLERRTPPIDWRALEVWRANGMRVLAVPAAELSRVRAQLGVSGPAQSQWLGEVTVWTEVARSPEGRRSTVWLDNGALTLRDGRLSLALRCWFAPDRPTDGAASTQPGVLEVELVPRFVPAADDATRLRAPAPRGGGEADGTPGVAGAAPIVFDRLRLGASMRGGDALLVVAEAPETDWQGPPGNAGEPGARPLGPPVPGAPTLGEHLLGSAGSAGSGRRTRLVLVITPSVPGVFRMLSDAGGPRDRVVYDVR